MERITQHDLEAVRKRIERTVGINPDAPVWTAVCRTCGEAESSEAAWSGTHKFGPRDHPFEQRSVSSIGRFYIDRAYGGVALFRVMNEAGGVDDVFRSGHVSKRDLYYRMQAYIDGLFEGQVRRGLTVVVHRSPSRKGGRGLRGDTRGRLGQ